MSSWSARMSYSLQVASSDPVITALPLGKNWKKEDRIETRPQLSKKKQTKKGRIQKWCGKPPHPHPNCVDVTLMASKSLSACAISYVPELGSEVTCPWDEKLEVWGHSQGHAVSLVSSKDSFLGSCLNIPQYARRKDQRQGLSQVLLRKGCGNVIFSSVNQTIFLPSAVSRAGYDLSITEETTAGQVTCRTKETLFNSNIRTSVT